MDNFEIIRIIILIIILLFKASASEAPKTPMFQVDDNVAIWTWDMRWI